MSFQCNPIRNAAAVLTVCMLTACVLTACAGGRPEAENSQTAGPDDLQTKELFAMDTYMTLTAYGEDAAAALEEAGQEILRLDKLLSAENSGSEIGLLNAGGGGPASEETICLVERAEEISAMTDGAFEITLYPVKILWGFTDDAYRVPSQAEIEEALRLVGPDKLTVSAGDGGIGDVTDSSVEGSTGSVLRDSAERSTDSGFVLTYAQPGVKIDLGGIAKGYTSSRVMEIFREHGVKGLVNLGGNVQACGGKPDGSDWKVAIRKPESAEEKEIRWVDETTPEGKALGRVDFPGIVQIHDRVVVTSGGYERFFEKDGSVYHHILDPATGYPSDSDLVSATVISEDGTLADGLSTSLFVMGSEKAASLWRDHADLFDMILIDRQGRLYVSGGLEGKFESDLDINWIRK